MIECIKNSYGEFNAVQHIGPAEFPHFDLIRVHNGDIEITIMHSETVRIHTGQSIIIYPKTPFHGKATNTLTKVSVHHFKINHGELKDKTKGFKTFLIPPPEQIRQDINRIVQLAYKEQSLFITETKSALMNLILTQVMTPLETQNTPPIINAEFQQLLSWMHDNISKQISLSDMADKTNYSESHFRMLFRSHLGKSPGAYFLDMRMHHAARLLQETTMPIKEVCQNIGYNEIPHFYRAFFQAYNMTPAAYRKKHRPIA